MPFAAAIDANMTHDHQTNFRVYNQYNYWHRFDIIPSRFGLNHMHCEDYNDGLMQNKRNSIADALELRLFCIKPSIFNIPQKICTQDFDALVSL